MKEKINMAAFFAAGIGDIATTAYALSHGYGEIGIAGHGMVESGNVENAFILRMAVTAVLIGVYALAKEHNNRFAFSFDKALRIGNMMMWGVLAINTVQLAMGNN